MNYLKKSETMFVLLRKKHRKLQNRLDMLEEKFGICSTQVQQLRDKICHIQLLLRRTETSTDAEI